jgi:hypothetical protein
VKFSRLGLVFGMAGGMVILAISAHPVHAATHRAGLVIQHASGSVLSRCVSFVENQLSGLQLIQRSGVSHQVKDFGSLGVAVCQLDNEPNPVPAECFGRTYWQYFHRTGSGWAKSALGPGNYMVMDGGVDGWRFADGEGQPPAELAFSQVCGSPESPPATSRPSASQPASPAVQPAYAPLPTPSPTPTLEPATSTPTLAIPATGATPKPASASARASPWPAILLAVGALALVGLALLNLSRRRSG